MEAPPHLSGSNSFWRRCLLLGIGIVGLLGLLVWVSEPHTATSAALGIDDAVQSPFLSDRLQDGTPGPDMVVLPAGSFQMGDLAASGNPDELPVHEVTIARPFALSRTEVTISQFAKFVESTGYQTDAERNVGGKGCVSEANAGQGDWGWVEGRSWRDPGYPQSGDHPVACVSWNDAIAYVGWLSLQTGQLYRLPTEAEWEYAARAGTLGRTSIGNDESVLCRVANIGDMTLERAYGRTPESACDDGYARTAPVGSFEPNPFGLFDMHGNVWEWVADCWHDNYRAARADGRAWIAGGDCTRRVLRSGSWFNEPALITSSYRDWDFSEDRYDGFGFRLARDLEHP